MPILPRNIVQRIFEFNKTVVGITRSAISPLGISEARWLRKALHEEGDELLDATQDYVYLPHQGPQFQEEEDRVIGQVDACCDAAVFAIGGLARIGLTSDQALECIHAVMDANFEKKAGVKPGREGAADAVKPEGWVGPEERIKEILYGKR